MIYVITSGDYSDYSIRGACSTKEIAERVISNARDAEEYWSEAANIEEWELDELLAFKRIRYWHCGMLLDDGTVVEPKGQSYASSHDFCRPFRSRIYQYDVKVPLYNNRPIVRVHSAVSGAHALKVAIEQRQKWLREKA